MSSGQKYCNHTFPGCEYYYNPQLKKQKEEEKKKIASELGTDVSNSDFSQFLKLLKMSGVLNSEGESLIQSSLLKNKTPRPRNRPGGRRKPPRLRRPTTPRPRPVYDYYYDYDYEYGYEDYDQTPADTFSRASQRGRPSVLAKVGLSMKDNEQLSTTKNIVKNFTSQHSFILCTL